MNDPSALHLVAAAAALLGRIAANTARVLLTISALFVPIWLFERAQGSDTTRYKRRGFAQDVAYALFYDGHAFQVLGASLIWGAIQNQLGFMKLGLFDGLPIVLIGVLYFVIQDLIAYWLHRAEHTFPFLWQFHAVHHAPEEINFLTSWRVHPFPRLVWGTADVFLLILLGVPPTWWLGFTLARSFLVSVQHAELNWSYGPLYRVVVSPVFHRLHHSRDRRDFDSNYSSFFSFWDYLFGTANARTTAPKAVGVEGLPPERTLIGQFFGPFRRLAGLGGVAAAPKSSGTPQKKKEAKKPSVAAR